MSLRERECRPSTSGLDGEKKTPGVTSLGPSYPRDAKASRTPLELPSSSDESEESTSSSISFEDGDFANIPSPEESVGRETTELPPPLLFSGSEPLVFFDLETTGFGLFPEILQISAMCGDKTFNRFSPPEDGIDPEASQVNGLTMKNGVLCKNGKPVPTVPLQRALSDFLKFLASVADARYKPVLIGHNILTYDLRILLRSLRSFDMLPKLTSVATFCMDTLEISRKVIPQRLVKDYRQMTLVEEFLGETYETKDARKDVTYLQQLYQLILEDNFDPSEQLFHVLYPEIRQEFSSTVNSEHLSDNMAKRLARSGLSLDMLRAVFEKDGEQGIWQVLSAPCGEDQGPRISKHRSVSQKLSSHFTLEKERTARHGRYGVSRRDDNTPREFPPLSKPALGHPRQAYSNELCRAPSLDRLMMNFPPLMSWPFPFSSRAPGISVQQSPRRAFGAIGSTKRGEVPGSSWQEPLPSLTRSMFLTHSRNPPTGDGQRQHQDLGRKSNPHPSMFARAGNSSLKETRKNDRTPSPNTESTSSSWSLPSLSSSSTSSSPPPSSLGDVKLARDRLASRAETTGAKTPPSLAWSRPNFSAFLTPRRSDPFSSPSFNQKKPSKTPKRSIVDRPEPCKKLRFEAEGL